MRPSLEKLLTVPLVAAALSSSSASAGSWEYFSEAKPVARNATTTPSRRGLYKKPGRHAQKKVQSIGNYSEISDQAELVMPGESARKAPTSFTNFPIRVGVNAPSRHPRYPSKLNKAGLDDIEIKYSFDHYGRLPHTRENAFRESVVGTHVYLALPKGVEFKYTTQEVVATRHKDKKAVTFLATPFDESDLGRHCAKINKLLESGKTPSREDQNQLETLMDNLIGKLPQDIERVASWTKKASKAFIEHQEEQRLKRLQTKYPEHNLVKIHLLQADGNPLGFTARGRKIQAVIDARRLKEDAQGFVLIPSLAF